jgi:ligand-binding SRPBCC domain-containing protein
MARSYRLVRTQRVRAPLDDVFAFFSEAENLDALTPPFLRFRILTPTPIVMREGARIEYALSLFGIRFRWRTRITVWESGARFVDEQESGPYARWVHTHTFEADGDTTVIRDVVDYALPLGPVGELAHALLIERTLARIFDFRHEATARRLGGAADGARPVAARVTSVGS